MRSREGLYFRRKEGLYFLRQEGVYFWKQGGFYFRRHEGLYSRRQEDWRYSYKTHILQTYADANNTNFYFCENFLLILILLIVAPILLYLLFAVIKLKFYSYQMFNNNFCHCIKYLIWMICFFSKTTSVLTTTKPWCCKYIVYGRFIYLCPYLVFGRQI